MLSAATVSVWCGVAEAASGKTRGKSKKLADFAKQRQWEEGEAYFRERLLAEGERGRAPKSKTLDSLMFGHDVCRVMPYADGSSGEGGFADWLLEQKQRVLLEELTLSMDESDDPRGAMAVLRLLWRDQGDAMERFPSLSAAYALVWDTKPGEKDKILSDYAHFTRNSKGMIFDLRSLPVELAKFVVCSRTTAEEKQWALKRYRGTHDLKPLFFEIEYDRDYYHRGEPKKLKGKAYTLPSILEHGGVCVDQAYYAIECGRAMGIPATKARARGRSGIGHAWVGFLELQGNVARWNFRAGRYESNRYYTGHARDPQTGEKITDHDVELAAVAYNLSSRQRRKGARLVRLAKMLRKEGNATRAATVVQAALRSNPFHKEAWLMYADLGRRGAISASRLDSALDTLVTRFRDYPDLSFEVLERLVCLIPPSKSRKRLKLYDRAYKLYWKRPDLAARVRIAQADYLAELGRTEDAVKTYADTLSKFFEDGPIALSALDRVSRLLREEDRLDQVIALHREVLSQIKVPKSSAFARKTTYSEVGRRLIRLLGEKGDKRGAEEIQRRLDELKPEAR